MALSSTQRFLLQACKEAGMDSYFRWSSVGNSLGMSAPESQQVVISLDQRKLIRVLSDGNARLLDAGKRMGAGLDAKQRGLR